MRKVMKFKFYNLLSNRLVFFLTILSILLLNFNAIFQSGILFSGGGEFNGEMKYTLLMNNYQVTASLFGIILAILIGTMLLGPDRQSGNIYVLLSAYPNRIKYFASILLTGLLYAGAVQILLLFNVLGLLFLFDVSILWADLAYVFVGIVLNSLVVLVINSIFSMFMKGMTSAVSGLAAYSFFSIYMFNEIPLVHLTFQTDVTRYKEYLCHIVPITHVLVPSITEEGIQALYQCHSIVGNMYFYQIIYASVLFVFGCWLFQKIDLV